MTRIMIPDYKKQLQHMKKWQRRLFYFFLGALLMGILLPSTAYGIFRFYYYDLIFPGVTVAGVPLGGLSTTEAEERLEFALDRYLQRVFPLTYEAGGNTWEFPYERDTIPF
jgi:hypothetical protein